MLESFPEDIEKLKKQIALLTQEKALLEQDNIAKQKQIARLENIIIDFKRNTFGSKSEKLDSEDYFQSRLFNEAEANASTPDGLYDGHSETEHIKSYERKKPGRKPLPSNLPRKEIIHDIPDSEKICDCKNELVKIGEEVSEKLGYVPAQVYVEKHIKLKYACKRCEGDERNEFGKIVVTAGTPPELYPKSILTPELFAYIIISKYLDHIPFYRMEKILLRHSIEITRATFSNWTIGVYERHKHLFSFMKEFLLSGPLLGIDESPLQVHNERERSDTQKSFMWHIRGGTALRPMLWYIYRETRSADFLVKYLQKYYGIIQMDGYTSYDAHFRTHESIIHAGCMAHVRRQFDKIWKAVKNPIAGEALLMIRKLYHVEREIRNLKLHKKELFSEIVRIRQEQSKPTFEALNIYLKDVIQKQPSSLALGQAINYALGQWSKLEAYLSHGECYIDNNLVENGIRPFALGRKNWLFSGCPEGAEASAFWYSFLLTAKANGRNPNVALLEFLKGLPYCNAPDDCKVLFSNVMGWG